MNWILLLLAGLLEVAWAVGLKYTAGFTRLLPSVLTIAAMALSLYLLSMALRTLPLSVAYPVWVGIGVVGAAIAGLIWFDEGMPWLKIISLLLIVAGIAGMKLTSSP